MPFDYTKLDLEAVAAMPVKPQWEGKNVDVALKASLKYMVKKGQIKIIFCGDKVFKLVEI